VFVENGAPPARSDSAKMSFLIELYRSCAASRWRRKRLRQMARSRRHCCTTQSCIRICIRDTPRERAREPARLRLEVLFLRNSIFYLADTLRCTISAGLCKWVNGPVTHWERRKPKKNSGASKKQRRSIMQLPCCFPRMSKYLRERGG